MNRYDRQARVSKIGPAGQAKMAAAHIVIVGLGALGSYAAEELVRAGVGELTLVDPDTLSFTNLQRQTMYTEADVNAKKLKVEAAKEHLLAINSQVKLHLYPAPLSEDVLVANQFDLLLDCLDNYTSRDLVNHLAIKNHFNYLFASCAGTFGSVMAVKPDSHHPCLRCLYPNIEQLKQTDCDLIGVTTPLVPLVASLQVALAMKILIAPNQVDYDHLITLDSWSMQFQKFKIQVNDHCLACQKRQVPTAKPFQNQVHVLCGTNTYSLNLQAKLDLAKLANQLANYQIKAKPGFHFIGLEWHNYKVSIFENGRLLLYGASSLAEATAELTALQEITIK